LDEEEREALLWLLLLLAAFELIGCSGCGSMAVGGGGG